VRGHHLWATAGAALVLAAGAAPALSQDARGAAPSKLQCFDISQRTGILALNDHTVLIRANGQVYQVTTQTCPGLAHSDPRIDVVVDQSSFVCGRLDYRLRVGEMGVPGSQLPCIVQSQRRLTPAEVAALPPSSRPGGR
jgi:hypothetical protein